MPKKFVSTDRLPDFVIIGAQKAGSTYFQECIRDHPSVYMDREEDAFFEDVLQSPRAIEKYVRQFSKVPPGSLIGIKRPNYIANPGCIDAIKEYCPDAKLIVILRDPVSRAVSAYFHYIRHGIFPVRPINVGMSQILSGKCYENYPRMKEILEFGLYHKHLSYCLKKFDRSQIFIRLQKHVLENPTEQAKQAYQFLGIDDSHDSRRIQVHPMKGVYSMWRLRFTGLSNKYKHQSEDKMRIYKRPGVYSNAMIRMINVIDKFVLAKFDFTGKPQLDTAIKDKLRQYYAEDICKLEKLLEIDLSHWKS